MKRLPALCVLVLAAGLAGAPAAHAQWKWKDAGGVVQYSDRPPPQGTAEKDILQRPAPGRGAVAATPAASAVQAAAAAASKPAVDPRRQAEQAEAARKQAAEEERMAKVRAENCQRARGQLRALEEGLRMARVNEKGEREVMDDKARADEAQRTRAIVASDCAR